MEKASRSPLVSPLGKLLQPGPPNGLLLTPGSPTASLPGTPPWAPVADSGRLFSTLNQSPSAGERALYFQVRREMMRFPSLELFRGSNHSPLICNLVSNRYGGQSRFFSQNVVCTFALHRSNGKGGMVATVLVTGEATPAWTTQRVPYNYWVTCRYSTSTTSWTPVAHRGGVFSTQQCTI